MNIEHDHACDRLDAYVDGDLGEGERDAFAAHILQCPACRDAIDQQRWLDGLLRSAEAEQLEALRPPLVLARRPRRRLLVAAAVAAALAAWPLMSHSRREGLAERPPTLPSAAAPEPPARDRRESLPQPLPSREGGAGRHVRQRGRRDCRAGYRCRCPSHCREAVSYARRGAPDGGQTRFGGSAIQWRLTMFHKQDSTIVVRAPRACAVCTLALLACWRR